MEKIVESVYYDEIETSGPGQLEASRQTVALANTEHTSAGLNPMLRGLVPGLGYPMLLG